jgi:hypothetical protein
MKSTVTFLLALGLAFPSIAQCWDVTDCNQAFPPNPTVGAACKAACPNFACWVPGDWCKAPYSTSSATVICQAGTVKFDQFGNPWCDPKNPISLVSHTYGIPGCGAYCGGGGGGE